MRRTINFIVFLLLLMWPVAAAAQRRVPATGSAAVGGDVGVFVARDEALGSGLALEGFYEYYFEPRASVRLGLGWANPKFEREGDDSVRHVRVAGDVVYNWEGGNVHPFAGAGLGLYFLQFKDNGESTGDSETKFGGTLFGGAEFFTGRDVSVKAEARYHVISDIGAFDPDGLSITIGVKKYF
jgi:hypothetical protein